MSEALRQAQECLSIHSVNLRQSNLLVRSEVDPWSYDRASAHTQSFRQVSRVQELELQIEGEAQSAWEYRFDYALGVRLIGQQADEADGGPLADIEIVAVFQARYLCKRRLEDGEFSAFAKDNVGYHVWPYWREFVQASCNRIGMSGPIEIPMYSMASD